MAVPAVVGAIGRLAAGGGEAMAIAQLAGSVTMLGHSSKETKGAIGQLTSALVDGLLAPLKGVQQLAGSIGGFVALFNPGVVVQFTLAMNDAMAVLGAMLVPVMQGLTIYTRQFGDVLAGLLPVMQPLFNAIGQFIANQGAGLADIFLEAAPFIQLFADAMTFLLGEMSKGLAFLQGVVAELIGTIAELFGLDSSRFKEGASSKGFAARKTSVSSVEQFAADLFASTARNVYARQTPDAKKPEALLGEIRKAVEEGKGAVVKLASEFGEMWTWLKNKFNVNKDIIDGAANGVIGPAAAAAIQAALGALGRKPW